MGRAPRRTYGVGSPLVVRLPVISASPFSTASGVSVAMPSALSAIDDGGSAMVIVSGDNSTLALGIDKVMASGVRRIVACALASVTPSDVKVIDTGLSVAGGTQVRL